MTSRLERWQVTAVIVLLVFTLGEVGMRVAETRSCPPSTWPSDEIGAKYEQIMDLKDHNERLDTLFVGSSAVFEGIDPVAFSVAAGGGTAYNAALGAASMLSIEPWTLDILVPLTSADTVFIGVIARDINDNGVGQRAFFERLQASPDFAAASGGPRNLADRLAAALEDSSALWRMRPFYREPITFLRGVVSNSMRCAEVGPFGSEPAAEQEYTYRFDSGFRKFWRDRQLHEFAFGGDEATALANLVDRLTAQGVEVVLVNMPVTEDYVSLLPDAAADQAEFELFLEALATESGARYFDANDVIESLEQFRDPAHLNPDGALILSEALARFVSS